MSPLYPMNEWSDVNIYFNIGKSIFNGRVLYSEAFDHKGPLIFFIYGFGYLISNTTFFGVFVLELLSAFALVSAVFLIGKFYLRKECAFIVSVLTLLVMLDYSYYGGAPEEFILAFIAVSLYLFLNYFRKGSKAKHKASHMLIHGLLFGATVCIKINLAVFWFFPVAAIFLTLLLSKQFKNFFINALSFVGGFLLVFLPLFLYFYFNNALDDIWEVYILLNSKYGQFTNDMFSLLVQRIYVKLGAEPINIMLITVGIFVFPFKHMETRFHKIVMFLTGLSLFLVIYLTPFFFFYYPLPLVIFAALGWMTLFGMIADSITINKYKLVSVIGLSLALLIGIQKQAFFEINAFILLRLQNGKGVVDQFSKVIMKEKNPTFANFGVGEENAIFTKCDIMPNVKYFITPNLTREVWPEMVQERTKYIEEKKLDFIVLANSAIDYAYYKNLKAFAQNYELVATFTDQRKHMKYDKNNHYKSFLYKKRK